MTGFIDLVFRKNGKYYILDWKSNCLDRNPENFAREGMIQEMASHAYFLQYLVYSVALHRFLGQCISGYDYDTHFGGALYIFLRGVGYAGDSRNGVFFDKPEKVLIEKLACALMGDR
jgi:exodeoxyribonuclease V beta subunit